MSILLHPINKGLFIRISSEVINRSFLRSSKYNALVFPCNDQPSLGYSFYRIIKRFTGGREIIKAIIYKGVPGAYTLSDPLLKKFKEYPTAFAIYIYNHFQLYRYKQNEHIDPLENIITNTDHAGIRSRNSWKDPKIIAGVTPILVKPFALMLPFNQHFIAHSFRNRRLDAKKIEATIRNRLTIDLSEYYNEGLTVQNLLEILVAAKANKHFISYCVENYGRQNIHIKAHNPIFNAPKISENNAIQLNNDFIITLTFDKPISIANDKGVIVYTNKSLPMDTKIIAHPEKNLSMLNGNVSLAYNYNFFEHITKFNGSFSAFNTAGYSNEMDQRFTEYKTQFTISYNEYKVENNKKEGVKNINIIKNLESKLLNIQHEMLCDPMIKDIYPSLIAEADIMDETLYNNNFSVEEQAEFFAKVKIAPEPLFPIMGKENNDYHTKIEYLISLIPKKHQGDYLKGFEDFYNATKILGP
jgi:hypothetical protein